MATVVLDTDLGLLARYASSRDAGAFAELARRYAGLVVATAHRITGSLHDSEDIAQSVFLELARNADSVRTSVPGYLHRVATTRSLNLLRANATRKRHESTFAECAHDMAANEILPLIDAAIAQLPDDLRIPLVLHYLQGNSQAEVGRVLGLSQATVSRRMGSAISALRSSLRLSVPAAGALMETLVSAAPQNPAPHVLAAINKLGISGVGPVAIPASRFAWAVKWGVATIIVIGGGWLTAQHIFSNAHSVPVAAASPTTQEAIQQADGTEALAAARGARALSIVRAVINYANVYGGPLPPDLGAARRFIDTNGTDASRAERFISPAEPHLPEIPESPNAAWVNAHSSYVYLGNGQLREDVVGEHETAIVHEKLELATDGTIVVGFLDGHTERMTKAGAETVIEVSKKKLEDALRQLQEEDASKQSPSAQPEGKMPSFMKNPLFVAAMHGQVDKVKKMLDVDPGALDKLVGGMRATLLHIAAYNGHENVVAELLRRGAEVNIQTRFGHTPLYDCVDRFGTLEVAKMLLDHGADVTIPDNEGTTPLQLALKKERTDMAALLRAHGAKE